MKVLSVFVDTNVFLQCKALRDVDWNDLGSWDRIDLIVTRPVVAEIDALKDRGNERRAARARSTSSVIRDLLQAPGHRQQVVAKPDVQLCLRYDLKRHEPKPDDLDYNERDHQLVGSMLAFHRAQPDAEVILLTNDTGPVACAKLVDLPARFVPEDWLLQPEPADSGLSALRAELDDYKSQEPRFAVSLSRSGETPSEKGLEVNLSCYEELTQAELSVLSARLASRFPQRSDFGPSEPQERVVDRKSEDLPFLGSFKEVWRPARKEEIEAYQADYAQWWERCMKMLGLLHTILNARQEWPRVVAAIENKGSRPANDALVVLEIHGNGQLRPPRKDEDGTASFTMLDDDKFNLAQPPSAPSGAWLSFDPLSASSRLARSLKDLMGSNHDRLLAPGRPLMPYMPTPRDANSMYFKEGGPGEVLQRIEFECAQWRHAQVPETIEVSLITTPVTPGVHSGVVRAEVHAANLTRPQTATLPFKLTLTRASCFEEAKRCIEAL